MKRFIRVYGSGSGSVRHPGLQRIFATLYFARSFFDDIFLQRFILRQFFLIAKINSQKKSTQKIFAYLFLH